MNIVLSILSGLVVGALPFNYLINEYIPAKAETKKKDSTTATILIVIADFMKGILAANLPVFILNGAFTETTVSMFSAMLVCLFIPWNKKYGIRSLSFLAGAFLFFNPLILFSLLVIWIILLIYKRVKNYADIFSLLMILILVIAYPERLNNNCYPPADSEILFTIGLALILLLQIFAYINEIKTYFNSNVKSLEDSTNESN